VIGIMGSEGRSIGVDVQDFIIIPVASVQQLFKRTSLFRILLEVKTRSAIESVK
jgi:putative ABC transport system permease protein